MKCICGYDDNRTNKFWAVGEDKLYIKDMLDWVYIIHYACPKCGTIRISPEDLKIMENNENTK